MNQQPDTTTLEGKIAVMQAAKDGKRVQVAHKFSGIGPLWTECLEPKWDWHVFDYRIHPEDLNPPKLRPWRPEEVPVGGLFRYEGAPACVYAILAKDADGFWIRHLRYSLQEVYEGTYSHSTDNGQTWKPCGVLE